jgi:hypothetical protein
MKWKQRINNKNNGIKVNLGNLFLKEVIIYLIIAKGCLIQKKNI